MKILIKNIQYFEYEVEPDRIEEVGDWQAVVDLDFESTNANVTQMSDDYYEYIKVIED